MSDQIMSDHVYSQDCPCFSCGVETNRRQVNALAQVEMWPGKPPYRGTFGVKFNLREVVDAATPRRNDILRNMPAELAIREAMKVVEAAGCDVRLTAAVLLLDEARERVADFIDGRYNPSLRVQNPAVHCRCGAEMVQDFTLEEFRCPKARWYSKILFHGRKA